MDVWKAVQQKSLAEISESLTLVVEMRQGARGRPRCCCCEPDLKKVEELLQSAIRTGRVESLPARKETSDNP